MYHFSPWSGPIQVTGYAWKSVMNSCLVLPCLEFKAVSQPMLSVMAPESKVDKDTCGRFGRRSRGNPVSFPLRHQQWASLGFLSTIPKSSCKQAQHVKDRARKCCAISSGLRWQERKLAVNAYHHVIISFSLFSHPESLPISNSLKDVIKCRVEKCLSNDTNSLHTRWDGSFRMGLFIVIKQKP